MKKILLGALSFMLKAIMLMTISGCAFFQPHKIDIEQGNVITQREVRTLHPGMSISQVKEMMGTPLLTNLFTKDRIDYVYTYQAGGKPMHEKRVICLFQHGILKEIITH